MYDSQNEQTTTQAKMKFLQILGCHFVDIKII